MKRNIFFKPSSILDLDSNWKPGLIILKVFNSIFNITHEENKLEIYTDIFDEFSFEELKDELEEIVNISNISPNIYKMKQKDHL